MCSGFFCGRCLTSLAPRHCSFCFPGGAEASIEPGAACISGTLSGPVDDYGGSRCADAISESAYASQAYFQWSMAA